MERVIKSVSMSFSASKENEQGRETQRLWHVAAQHVIPFELYIAALFPSSQIQEHNWIKYTLRMCTKVSRKKSAVTSFQIRNGIVASLRSTGLGCPSARSTPHAPSVAVRETRTVAGARSRRGNSAARASSNQWHVHRLNLTDQQLQHSLALPTKTVFGSPKKITGVRKFLVPNCAHAVPKGKWGAVLCEVKGVLQLPHFAWHSRQPALPFQDTECCLWKIRTQKKSNTKTSNLEAGGLSIVHCLKAWLIRYFSHASLILMWTNAIFP